LHSGWRFVAFLGVVLAVWTGMHAYVLWRIWPFLASSAIRRGSLLVGAMLWLSFPMGRILEHWGLARAGLLLQSLGAVWMGILFLSLACLFLADIATGFGWLLPRQAPATRLTALAVAGFLSTVALVQGLRPPTIQDYEVGLAGLPTSLDGTVLVQLSDMHLGGLLGRRWLSARVAQVEALKPDLLVITGDLVDGDAGEVAPLLPELQHLRAPLGVWAVTGNHEFYAGVNKCVALMEEAGIKVLRNRAEMAAPGLILAGVDDLSARRQFKVGGDPLTQALEGRPGGATVLLCHSPLDGERAAALGAGLMLSGHTHNGQIWPFGFLVRLAYPRLRGRYEIGAMTLLVSRGTGTWGPPMRLFGPSEITRVTLRATDGRDFRQE
jgi:uncharacterized protein